MFCQPAKKRNNTSYDRKHKSKHTILTYSKPGPVQPSPKLPNLFLFWLPHKSAMRGSWVEKGVLTYIDITSDGLQFGDWAEVGIISHNRRWVLCIPGGDVQIYVIHLKSNSGDYQDAFIINNE